MGLLNCLGELRGTALAGLAPRLPLPVLYRSTWSKNACSCLLNRYRTFYHKLIWIVWMWTHLTGERTSSSMKMLLLLVLVKLLVLLTLRGDFSFSEPTLSTLTFLTGLRLTSTDSFLVFFVSDCFLPSTQKCKDVETKPKHTEQRLAN